MLSFIKRLSPILRKEQIIFYGIALLLVVVSIHFLGILSVTVGFIIGACIIGIAAIVALTYLAAFATRLPVYAFIRILIRLILWIPRKCIALLRPTAKKPRVVLSQELLAYLQRNENALEKKTLSSVFATFRTDFKKDTLVYNITVPGKEINVIIDSEKFLFKKEHDVWDVTPAESTLLSKK